MKIRVHFERIIEHLKYAKRDPRWFLMFVFSRFFVVRQLVKAFSRKFEVEGSRAQDSVFDNLHVGRTVDHLKQEGVFTDLQLPSGILERFLKYAESVRIYGDGNYSNGFLYPEKERAEEKAGKSFSTGNFFNVHEDFPLVRELGADPKLMMIAAEYLGSEPIHVNSRMWWNFVSEEEHFDSKRTASFFHFDKDDFSCLRLFFYLTDVDSQSGPHVCVPSSHRKKKISQLLALKERSDQEIIDVYGKEKMLKVMGAAGSGFFEDPFCFHKGTRPTEKNRLILSLKFATCRYSAFNFQPHQGLLKSVFDTPI